MKIKMMTPADLKIWIARHDSNISCCARMMKMHRRTLQRKLEQRAFTAWEGFLFTMFCQAYDLGYAVHGMGSMKKVAPKCVPGPGRPRKETLRRMDLNHRPAGYEPTALPTALPRAARMPD